MTISEKNRENIDAFAGKIFAVPGGVEALIQSLEKRGVRAFKSISMMSFPEPDPDRFAAGKVGVVMDTETCGNEGKQSVVQLSMVRFRYDEKGFIGLDGKPFDKLRDPGHQISPEGFAVHGISDDMVSGKSISDEEVARYTDEADLITAHNAEFDRKVCERDFPDAGFDRASWACSMQDVSWKEFGILDKKLELICMRLGFMYPAHGALDDSIALLHALTMAEKDGVTALSRMVENSSKTRVLVLAVDVPFDKKGDGSCGKELIKPIGFSFSGEGEAAGIKTWYKTYASQKDMLEDAPVIRQAYGGRDVSLGIRIIDGKTMYSNRLPDITHGGFRTSMPQATMGFGLLDPDGAEIPDLPTADEDILLQF